MYNGGGRWDWFLLKDRLTGGFGHDYNWLPGSRRFGGGIEAGRVGFGRGYGNPKGFAETKWQVGQGWHK